MSGLSKIALPLAVLGILAILVAPETRAQWRAPSPAPDPPAPPPAGISRGENFSAGKTPAQLFASDCTGAGCHKGPQGLGRNKGQAGLAGFLREHYTNSRESAGALAAYLMGVPGDARAAKPAPEPRPPRALARPDDIAKPEEAAWPRRQPPETAETPRAETPKPPPGQRTPRGRQAIVAPAPAAPAPETAPAPPEPPAAPPRPQWDIFD